MGADRRSGGAPPPVGHGAARRPARVAPPFRRRGVSWLASLCLGLGLLLLTIACGRGLRPTSPPLAWKPQGFAGSWCWESGPETRRRSDGLPYHTFKIRLEENGRVVTGHHCAVASWGSRIDCAFPPDFEPSIYGRIHDGYAVVEVRSAYTEIAMDARLVPTLRGLRWEPLSAPARLVGPRGEIYWADWYMPWEKAEMCPCGWLEDDGEDPGGCKETPARKPGRSLADVWSAIGAGPPPTRAGLVLPRADEGLVGRFLFHRFDPVRTDRSTPAR